MMSSNNIVDFLAQTLGLDAPEIARRKAFLEFNDTDVQLLMEVHGKLQDVRRRFVDDFYAHLLKFEEPRNYIPDTTSLDHLKHTQTLYFERLTAGNYDSEYILDRLRVGVAHQHSGLAQKWYIGAYGKYLIELLPELWRLLRRSPRKFLETCAALHKVVLLDMELAVDTYIHASHLAILDVKQYAENIIESLPVGLAVCDKVLKVNTTNRAFRALVGLTSQNDIAGHDITDMLPVAGVRQQAMNAVTNGTTSHGIETTHGDKTLRLTFAGMRLAREQDNCLLLVVEDVSADCELRAQARAREAEAHYHDLVQGLDAIVWEADATTLRFTFISRHAETILGYPVERWFTNPRFWLSIIYPPDRERVIAFYEEAARRGDGHDFDYRAVAADGRLVWLHDIVRVVRDESGSPCQLRGVMVDITKRIQAENELKLFRTLIDRSNDAFEVIDPETGQFLDINERGCTDLGYTRSELLCLRVSDVDPTVDPEQWPGLSEALRTSNSRTWEGIHRRKDGSTFPVEVNIKYIRFDREYFVAAVRDITERQRTQDRLNHLAHYDSLTDLPNRNLFYDRLKQTLVGAARHQRAVGVLFLDLDRFKVINDSLGHGVGDRLLKAVAERLQDGVREGDTIARIGGDEFVMILDDMALAQDAAVIAQKTLDSFAQPFLLDVPATGGAQEFFVTPSIGISVYPTDGDDADALLKNADSAMYYAKGLGGNGYHCFTQEMDYQAHQRLSLERALRKALDREEFVLYYQPQVDWNLQTVTGVEALLRWNRPQHGLVTPADFIPLLEDTGLIVQAGEWVIREACAQIAAWRAAGMPRVRVAVNVSTRQLRDERFADTVAKALADSGMDPTDLELEITESTVMQHSESSLQILSRVRSLGVRLAMDDFGTGYSSLSQLKRLPINAVKIDQSFVRDMPSDENDTAIVHAIIGLARALRLDVIAEGVETEEQRAFLHRHGCGAMQGYLFSKPLPAAEVASVLQRGLPCLSA